MADVLQCNTVQCITIQVFLRRTWTEILRAQSCPSRNYSASVWILRVTDNACLPANRSMSLVRTHRRSPVPARTVRVRGTTKVWPAAACKWLLPGTDETNVQASARYDGASHVLFLSCCFACRVFRKPVTVRSVPVVILSYTLAACLVLSRLI